MAKQSPIDDGPTDREYSLFGTMGAAPNTVLTLEGSGVDVAIDNTGSTTHTFTGKSRGSNVAGSTIAILASNQGVLINGKGVAQVSIDSADSAVIFRKGPRGTVSPFRVGNQPVNQQLASTVVHDFAGSSIEPNANNTLQMAGLGSALSLTPKLTGIVRLEVTCVLRITTAANNFSQVKGAFGTGSAPALHAAAVGTASEILLQIVDASAALDLQLYAKAVITFTGLTVGTLYWFDLQALVTTTGNESLAAYDASVSELPA